MADLLLRLAFLAGFCLATVGAAGFAQEREPQAVPFLAAGLAIVAATGVAQRLRRGRAERAAGGGGVSRAGLAADLAEVLAAARRIEAEAAHLAPADLAARLDELSVRCAVIGNRNEEYQRLLGLRDYTAIWDGFATGERLLARAWSMSTDGYPNEARAELPRARAQFERAAAAAHG